MQKIFHTSIFKNLDKLFKDKSDNDIEKTELLKLKKLKVCMVDNGLFSAFAETIADKFNKFYYYVPTYDAFPMIKDLFCGYGLNNVIKIRALFEHYEDNDNLYDFDDIDIFIFCDIGFSDLQMILRKLNKIVWGAGIGENIETFRYDAKLYFKKLGLNINEFESITGINNLMEYIKHVKGVKYIKINNLIRGLFETYKHEDKDITMEFLKRISSKVGIMGDYIEFVIEDAISSVAEIGYDGFVIDGKFPSVAQYGYEIKGEAYGMHVKKYEDVSKHVTDVNEKLSKFFKKIQYRGFFSTEIIVSNNKKDYLIDPCMRLGNPPAAITEAAISNLAEVVANGAVGNLVNPIYKSKYAVQLSIYNTEASNNNLMVKVPDSISEYVKLNFAFKAKDVYTTLANGSTSQGYVVGLGDTLEDAKKHCIDNAKKISGNGIEFNFGAFEKLDKVIEKGKTIGIDF